MAIGVEEIVVIYAFAAVAVLVAMVDLSSIFATRSATGGAAAHLAILGTAPALASVFNAVSVFGLEASEVFLLDCRILVRVLWLRTLLRITLISLANFEGPSGRFELVALIGDQLDKANVDARSYRVVGPPCIWPWTGVRFTPSGAWLRRSVVFVDIFSVLWVAIAATRQVLSDYGFVPSAVFGSNASSADVALEIVGVIATLFGLGGILPIMQLQRVLSKPGSAAAKGMQFATVIVILWSVLVGIIMPLPLSRVEWFVDHVRSFVAGVLCLVQVVSHASLIPPYTPLVGKASFRSDDVQAACREQVLPPSEWAKVLQA